MSHSDMQTSAPHAAPLPGTILHGDAMQHLLDLTGRLNNLLDEENHFLRTANREGFLALQPIKEALAEDYELTMKALRATKADVKGFNEQVRGDLLAQHELLQAKSAKNIVLLDTARDTTARLQSRLLSAARAALKKMEPPAYSRAGRPDDEKPAKPTSYSDAV